MLDKTNTKLTHVRPNYFMENLLQSLQTIATDGMIYLPFPGSIAFDMIATRDIAKVCGDRRLDENWDECSLGDTRRTELSSRGRLYLHTPQA